MQKPEEMHVGWRYNFRGLPNSSKGQIRMKLAACFSFAFAMTVSASAAEQCRFIEARAEREACYQRQEVARAARQKAQEAQQAAQQPKPYEPMAPEDTQLAKSMRGICRGC
jgi:hypothetical protein